MGLFDRFKGTPSIEMTPSLAFVAAFIYMMAADGVIEDEEINHLTATLGSLPNSGQLFDLAVQYVKKNSVETFIKEAAPVLSYPQKLSILINILDSALSDGDAATDEQELFNKFLQGFGIPEETLQSVFDVLILKN